MMAKKKPMSHEILTEMLAHTVKAGNQGVMLTMAEVTALVREFYAK